MENCRHNWALPKLIWKTCSKCTIQICDSALKYFVRRFPFLNSLQSSACPKCGFQASLWHGETVFPCPVETCRHASCTLCLRPDHSPLSCKRNAEKLNERCRQRTEEAMTQALVRKCPDPACPRIMIKSDGCNKMTCPCGTVFCNVCRASITNGYEHFCRTFDCQHKNCGKCGLWRSTKEEDDRAIDEAKRNGGEDARRLGLRTESSSSLQAPITTPIRKEHRWRLRLYLLRRRQRRLRQHDRRAEV